MNCEEARIYLTAHLDDELEVAGSLGMERHLAECPECRRIYEDGRTLRGAFRPDLYWETPSGLAKKVRASVKAEAKRERGPVWTLWRWAAIGALALLALVIGLRIRPGQNPQLVAEVVAGHVRSLQADHLMDVPSTDRHTVKPWFQGKLDYSPPVPDLPELTGGRLDYVAGRAVAALIYQRRQHRINVFVWPSSGAGGMDHYEAQGYQIVRWRSAGMEWWAVSDLNAGELMAFAKTISNALGN